MSIYAIQRDIAASIRNIWKTGELRHLSCIGPNFQAPSAELETSDEKVEPIINHER